MCLFVRFEETNDRSLECKSETNDICIGGYARMVSVIKRLKKTRTNPIYLNAGDNFSGTIWYTFGTWNVTQHFLNLLKADAMVNFASVFIFSEKVFNNLFSQNVSIDIR